MSGNITDITSRQIIAFNSERDIADCVEALIGCEVFQIQPGRWCVAAFGEGNRQPNTCGRLVLMSAKGRNFDSLLSIVAIALDISQELLFMAGDELKKLKNGEASEGAE